MPTYDIASLQQSADVIAQEYNLDPSFFRAQINQESGWNPSAVSKAGCVGIAQICDAVPFDRNDPYASMQYMAQRMSGALQSYGGNVPAALASYNCGIGCANAWVSSGAPISALPGETQKYIGSILGASAGAGSSSLAVLANTPGAQSATLFTPVALSAQATSFVFIFAAAILLLGVIGMQRKTALG